MPKAIDVCGAQLLNREVRGPRRPHRISAPIGADLPARRVTAEPSTRSRLCTFRLLDSASSCGLSRKPLNQTSAGGHVVPYADDLAVLCQKGVKDAGGGAPRTGASGARAERDQDEGCGRDRSELRLPGLLDQGMSNWGRVTLTSRLPASAGGRRRAAWSRSMALRFRRTPPRSPRDRRAAALLGAIPRWPSRGRSTRERSRPLPAR